MKKAMNKEKQLDKLLTRLKKLSTDVYITRNGYAVNKDTQFITKLNENAMAVLDRYFDNTIRNVIHIPDIRITKKDLNEGVLEVCNKKLSDPIIASIDSCCDVLDWIEDRWYVLLTENDPESKVLFEENEPIELDLKVINGPNRNVILTRNVLPPVTKKDRDMIEYSNLSMNQDFGITVFKLEHDFGVTYAFFKVAYID